jgi:multiple sugar transport system permease protein
MLKKINLNKIKRFLLGSRSSNGAIFTIILYLLLIALGFVYLYTLLFMFVTSLKSPTD